MPVGLQAEALLYYTETLSLFWLHKQTNQEELWEMDTATGLSKVLHRPRADPALARGHHLHLSQKNTHLKPSDIV